ncbi:uncharacterized protein [Leptinotarsa decemlineata]|uniref:uncharacterized protein n=1 Tax=Leptinotarsa decemlineata TaxID=7539 RepID=UPI003D304E55
MFMQIHITNTSNHIGTQSRPHPVFGEYPTISQRITSRLRESSVSITLPISPYQPNAAIHKACSSFLTFQLEVLQCSTQFDFHRPTQFYFHSLTQCDSTFRVKIQVCLESFTVQALYEGLLVISWTTAQSRPQRWNSSAQLATLLVLFATLTIANRCCAAPVVQLNHRPFHDSKRPTSSLVISRLFSYERDTSIISDDSIATDRNTTFVKRNKRAFEPYLRNRISRLRSKLFSESNSTTFKNSRAKYEQLSASDGGDSVDNTRVTLNETFQAENRQNGSTFPNRGSEVRGFPRPMPPAHAQDDESSNSSSKINWIRFKLTNKPVRKCTRQIKKQCNLCQLNNLELSLQICLK